MKLPKHECGLYLEHNPHKDVYETLEAFYLGDRWPSFVSEEAKQRSIDTNEIWTLRWYPLTPVGFYLVAAPSLEECLQFALEVESHNS